MNDLLNKIRAFGGVTLSISTPWLDAFGTSVQIFGGLAGLILVFVSIRHKRLQLENEKLRNQQLKDRANG